MNALWTLTAPSSRSIPKHSLISGVIVRACDVTHSYIINIPGFARRLDSSDAWSSVSSRCCRYLTLMAIIVRTRRFGFDFPAYMPYFDLSFDKVD